MISYEEDWLFLLLFQRKGSVAKRASYFAVPCALFSFLIVLMDSVQPISVDGHVISRQWLGMTQLTKTQLWTASTAILGLVLGFRTNRAMSRFWEGTGLLHQMRGEWFDSISCCVTFSHMALFSKRKEVFLFRHTLVRLMSLCHGTALEEIAGDSAGEVDAIDPFGLDNATICYLNDCKHVYNFNRVEALLHIIQTLITRSLDEGVLQVSPPILSRVYQTLSRGFVNLLNAKKIADTSFPFPYAQLISMLIALHMVVTPLLISCLVPSLFWAPVFTFVPIFGVASVNLISIELENPFGDDANDLPLHHFQGEMNKCLMMLLHPSADLIAGLAEERCIFDFQELARQFHSEGVDSTSWDRTEHRSPRLSNFEQDTFGTKNSQDTTATGNAYGSVATSSYATGRTAVYRRGSSASSIDSERPSMLEMTDMSPHRSLSAAFKHISSINSARSPLPPNIADSDDDDGRKCSLPATWEESEEGSDCDEPARVPQAISRKIGDITEAGRAKRNPVDDRYALLSELQPTVPLVPADMAKRDLDEKQIQELHRSFTALKEFTKSLTFVIESMISRRESPMPSPIQPNEESRTALDAQLQSKAAWYPSVRDHVPTLEPVPHDTEVIPPSIRRLQPQATGGVIIYM